MKNDTPRTDEELERELAAAREELTQAYAKLDCILKLTIHDDTFWAIEEIARISGGESDYLPLMPCSAGSMLRCYRIFIEYFPWKKSEFPTYDLWICSDADDARIFRQGWAARCSVLDSLPNERGLATAPQDSD